MVTQMAGYSERSKAGLTEHKMVEPWANPTVVLTELHLGCEMAAQKETLRAGPMDYWMAVQRD